MSEKRNVLRDALERERRRNRQILDNDWDLYGVPSGVQEQWDREDALLDTVQVRVAAEPWQDYGDMRQERS